MVPPAEPEQATRVDAVCMDDDAQGGAAFGLWELELGARVEKPDSEGLGAVARLDPPRHFAYLHALKWNQVTATDAALFQSPFRAGIKLFDHQLIPLKKALELPRANLFIADDVGPGQDHRGGARAVGAGAAAARRSTTTFRGTPRAWSSATAALTARCNPRRRCTVTTFVYPARAEDRVLEKLVAKVETIQAELGSLGDVVMQRIERALSSGIDQATEARLASEEPEAAARVAVGDELESQRATLDALREQTDQASAILNCSRRSIDFAPELQRDAVDVGLELACGQALTRADALEFGDNRRSGCRLCPRAGSARSTACARPARATKTYSSGEGASRSPWCFSRSTRWATSACTCISSARSCSASCRAFCRRVSARTI